MSPQRPARPDGKTYRGYPKVLIANNGQQIVGAEDELRLMLERRNKSQLKESCADRGMKWQFTTPSAPHQNDCSVAMVKTVKKALKNAIGDTVLTPFELYICLLEVAKLVNQRPIGRNELDDGAYLCPNDILMGRASSTVPQGPFPHTENPRHRFEFYQKIVDFGIIRNVQVNTSSGTYMRPITKICLIYPAEGFPE